MCNYPSNEQIKQGIARAHEQGALVFVNHIFWSLKQELGRNSTTLLSHPSMDELVEMGIDGIEVVNQDTIDWIQLQEAQKRGLAVITGTDMHVPSKVFGYTVAQSKSLSKTDIVACLKNSNVSVIFNARGSYQKTLPPIKTNSLFIAPLYDLGAYFNEFYYSNSGMYSFMSGFCHELKVRLYLIK